MSLLQRLQAKNIEQHPAVSANREPGPGRYQDLVYKIHREIVKDLGADNFDLQQVEGKQQRDSIEEEIKNTCESIMEREIGHFSRQDKEGVIQQVLDEVFGFGPITPLLNDESISEIMVNGPQQVYVEKKGKLIISPVVFRDNEHLYTIIERIISPLGRRLDESMPMVDARLPDGSRVNAIIPPLALNGCVLTIRKFSSQLLKVEDLIRNNTLTPQMAKFLEACVKGRLNMIVSGGTGAGKTSTLNIISSFIPSDDRIITIEDSAELDLKQEHIVSLETRPANIDRRGEISIRDLVRNSLRMRPDRLVVGEVRGGEALDMLQAMNTGHDGSLTTGHSNAPRDMISRLETMVLMAGIDFPVKAIREQITSALDIIVHQARLQDGSRKITHITEVLGMEGDIISLQDIFVFEQKGIDERGKVIGRHRATGIKPRCMEKLLAQGIVLPLDFFNLQ
ncbi:MAG: CpaF family protein [Syntrophomonadaceae bacterium]|nr:CpaF family protein [Syntrophomonadaceae bacterium]